MEVSHTTKVTTILRLETIETQWLKKIIKDVPTGASSSLNARMVKAFNDALNSKPVQEYIIDEEEE